LRRPAKDEAVVRHLAPPHPTGKFASPPVAVSLCLGNNSGTPHVPIPRRILSMQATVELPKAFSVRDEHEFFPIQHLMARLNPQLMVAQIAPGVHVNGGSTVYWGLVYQAGQPLEPKLIEAALKEAGFNFAQNGSIQTVNLPAIRPTEAKK